MTCLTPMLHLGSPAPTGQHPRPDGDMPPKGRLVAVIATHNRLASLSRALDALLESTSRDLAELRDYCDAALILEAGKLNYYADLNETIKAHKAILS